MPMRRANWLMCALRQRKIITVASLHLTDLTAIGRPVGHTFLTLAFEHAYDHITTCSEAADWCRGMGMPTEKLVPVVKAPTFAPQPEVIEEALAGRGRAERLRVLFPGRLDPQRAWRRWRTSSRARARGTCRSTGRSSASQLFPRHVTRPSRR